MFFFRSQSILGETREPVESAEPGGRVATECGVTVQITAGATLRRIYVGSSLKIWVINYWDRTSFCLMKNVLFFRCLLLSKFILYLNSSVSYQKVINCSIQYILFLLRHWELHNGHLSTGHHLDGKKNWPLTFRDFFKRNYNAKFKSFFLSD